MVLFVCLLSGHFDAIFSRFWSTLQSVVAMIIITCSLSTITSFAISHVSLSQVDLHVARFPEKGLIDFHVFLLITCWTKNMYFTL